MPPEINAMKWRQRDEISHQRVFRWLMIGALACLLLPGRWADRLGDVSASLLGPLSQGGRKLTLAATENARRPGRSETVGSEQYRRLADRLGAREAELANLTQENRRLRERFAQWSGLRQKFGLARVSLIDARVLGSDSSGWRQIKLLDQGAMQKIEAGQLVLSGRGDGGGRGELAEADAELMRQMSVVGRIIQVSRSSCRLQLINDPGFRLPVFVEPLGQVRQGGWRGQGVLSVTPGRGGVNEMVVGMVPVAGHPIRVGDAVLGCSDPRYLPVEMLVGFVADCQPERENPLMWRITVRAAVDLHRLERVTVVRTNKAEALGDG